jgi:hypothetical protein
MSASRPTRRPVRPCRSTPDRRRCRRPAPRQAGTNAPRRHRDHGAPSAGGVRGPARGRRAARGGFGAAQPARMAPRRGCAGRRQAGQFAGDGCRRCRDPSRPLPKPSLRPRRCDSAGTARAAPPPAAGASAAPPSRKSRFARRAGCTKTIQCHARAERRAARRPVPREDELLSSRGRERGELRLQPAQRCNGPPLTPRRTPLDEMTRDCLRPLLKAWLDENLPGMVERLVREEIARVARRGSADRYHTVCDHALLMPGAALEACGPCRPAR